MIPELESVRERDGEELKIVRSFRYAGRGLVSSSETALRCGKTAIVYIISNESQKLSRRKDKPRLIEKNSEDSSTIAITVNLFLSYWIGKRRTKGRKKSASENISMSLWCWWTGAAQP